MSEKLETINGKILKESSNDNYRNIITNREINNLKKLGFTYFKYKNNYLVGPDENIDEFLLKNKIKKSEIQLLSEIASDSPPKVQLQKSKNIKKDDFEDFKKFDESTCEINTAGSALFIPQTDDVEDIPDSILNNICPFEISHLYGKAKVVNIKDGDTIDLLFFVRLSDLAKEREKGRAKGKGQLKKKEMKYPIVTKNHETGFFTVFACRVSGIDAAEHDTAQGQLCTLLMEDYIRSLGRIVYIKIDKFDKYGRMMAEIFSDENFKNGINRKLVGVKINEIPDILRKEKIKTEIADEDLKIIALEYDGTAKDTRFKNFPKVPNDFINREKHARLLEKYKIK